MFDLEKEPAAPLLKFYLDNPNKLSMNFIYDKHLG